MRTILAIMLSSLPCVAQGQPSNNPVPRSPGAATKKELPERYHVMEAALRYMLKAHSSHGVERDYYSAYVLPKDGEFTPELVVAFAGYKPPVTADIEVSTGKGEARD